MAWPMPGKSVGQMYSLIHNNRVKLLENVFTDFLLMAICWEETFFNNMFQHKGGTGVGFGQVEPAEFKKLENETAMLRGYYLPGLPERVTTKYGNGADKTASSRALTDAESIQVQSAWLCHTYLTQKKATKRSVLDAYIGVGFSSALAQNPLSDPTRSKIVDHWIACETKLVYDWEYASRADIRTALRLAKGYPEDPQREEILFPESEKDWWYDD